jgi:hypothetical protein
MMVVFANNQVIVADAAAAPSVSITTDPVALNGFDRATMVAVINAMFGGTACNLMVQGQTSNDGVTFINDGPVAIYNLATDTPNRVTADVNGAFFRFVFTFSILAGAGMGAVIFDCHCKIDKK